MDISQPKTSTDINISVEDPISDAFFIDIWTKVANENSLIYEDTFNCYPTNKVNF